MSRWLKNIGRKFLPKISITSDIEKDYEKLGENLLRERTFFFGEKRYLVKCLQTEAAPGTAETVIKLFKEIAPQGKILDFGCGQHKSEYLLKMGFDVHSCDILPLEIENFTRINQDDKRLPFGDKQFDTSVISEVVEHVRSPWELLREIARVTKRYMIVTTPNIMSRKSKELFFKTGYLYWFTPENFTYHISPIFPWQMQLFCKSNNFRLEKIFGNHQVFRLNDKGKVLDFAESLIFKINLG